MDLSLNISRNTVALFVKDIEVSKDFYVNILRIPIDIDFGKNVILKNGLTLWEIQNNHIIPEKLGISNVSNESINRFEIYFETTDILSSFKILKDCNVKFLHELHDESWGQRTIRFFDPDNHLLEIGESIECFVNRLHSEGLNVSGINKKTHVPISEINRLLNI